jgi:transposase, IS6 family
MPPGSRTRLLSYASDDNIQTIARAAHPIEVTADQPPSTLAGDRRGRTRSAPRHEAIREKQSVEADYGRLKARPRPMRILTKDPTAAVVGTGHALVQNLRRSHYGLGLVVKRKHRLAAAFAELAWAI